MPFKSEKQRKYLWANEPEIARDWTKTYGSKVKKAEGGIMQDGYVNFTKGSDSVTIPKKFKARKDATPTHLAYITKAEAAQLKKQNKGTPHKGPKGIPSYDDYDAKTGSYSTGAEMSAAETGGSGHGMSESRARDIRRGAQAAAKASERQTKSKIDNFRQNSINSFVNRNKYKNLINAGVYKGHPGITAKILGLMNPPDEVGMFDEDDIKTLYAGGADPKGLAGLRKDFEFEEKFKNVDPTQKQFEDYYGLNQPITGGGGEGGGNPYIYPTTSVASAAESSGQSDFDKYLAGLGGDYQVPIEYVQNQTRAAEGGRIGLATGGIGDAMAARMVGRGFGHQDPTANSFKPRPTEEDVMTRFQMEDIQTPRGEVEEESVEEDRFAGPDWYIQRVEHLMFLGYSYEEASNLAYSTDSYLDAIGSDFASGGRVGYGLGSFVKKLTKAPKKAFKSIKKLAKSPLGKLALGYLATAGIGNIMQPGAAQWGSPLGKGSGWLRPSQLLKNYGLNQGANTTALGAIDSGRHGTSASALARKVANQGAAKDNLLTKGLKWGLKNPMASILGASTAAGLMAKKPIEEVGGIDKKWGKDKEWWDAYYANMPEEGDFRVEDEYILSAKGGRVAKNQGGLMNLGGLEKDYRNTGGFVEIGGKEKADDVPARLSRNEFVMTADAVRGAGGGDIDKGAALMDRTMKNLEAKGKGAKDMYQTATRLSEVI